jgi:type IV secretory pathway TrbD component
MVTLMFGLLIGILGLWFISSMMLRFLERGDPLAREYRKWRNEQRRW